MKNNKKTLFVRKSRQREVMLEVLKGTKSHPTADWIYQEVRKSLPKISLGTVYRNLKLLKERGEILELHYGDGQSRFDGNTENHYHFNCQGCGKVYDVEGPLKKDMERDIAEKLGFVITHHRVEFYGVCRECREEVSLHLKEERL
ncbi:MAG: transcriptional repressor [Deltaproteobacteria bacterium]|nr:transcriptional repressor [Deltaproteobacteria bacterium]